ncbi:MAG: delta-60 repeat domain-containing protein [Candidatus Paceibacterota bacterium]
MSFFNLNKKIKTILKNTLVLSLAFFLLISQSPSTALAAQGDLDTSFAPSSGADDIIWAAAQQADGKTIIGGDFLNYNGTGRSRIARINADGSLDSSFNVGTGFNAYVRDIKIQSDGKVIVTGNFTSYKGVGRARIARLNSDGSLDTTFDPGTGLNNYGFKVALQSDGKVVVGGAFTTVGGTSRNRIARLNTNGTLDTSFAPGTGFNGVVLGLAVQSDEKVLAVGLYTQFNGSTRKGLVRMNTDGSFDSTLNIGTGFNATTWGIGLQSDGKIVVSGQFSSFNGTARATVARVNSDGSIDSGFDVGTGPTVSYPVNVKFQPDGKIILVGHFTGFNGYSRDGIVRLNSDGSVDTTFNPGTGFNTAGTRVVKSSFVQPDGKILVWGEFTTYNGTARNRIARIEGAAPTSISYSGSFTEAVDNNGSVTGSIVATLANDTFVNPLTLNTHVTVTNVPTGLTAVVTRNSATQATITLTGNATNHAAANNI